MRTRSFLYAIFLFFASGLVWTPSPLTDIAAAQTRPDSFAELAEQLKPTVVNVQVTTLERRRLPFRSPFEGREGDPFEEFFKRFFGDQPPREFRRQGQGSGFIISPDGFIVTNNHVVGGATAIKVVLADKKEYEAELIGTDERTDLALLKIEADDALPIAELGDSDVLRVGDWVLAIGNPFGFGHTVTSGIVSAKGRVIGAGPYDDFIQTDASINPGNSGGPLFNLDGEVVGINTAIVPTGQGIGFSIPANMARNVIDQLQESGMVERGFLGVVIQDVTPELARQFDLDEPKGVLVSDVGEGGPAAEAGLQGGDVILEFGGKSVEDRRDLARMVAGTEAGKVVRLKILRDSAAQEVQVKLSRLEEEERVASSEGVKETLGLTVQNLTPELAERFDVPPRSGVLVSSVEPGSTAAQAGIRRGDLILEVNRRQVQDVEGFARALSQDSEDHLVLIQRGGNKVYRVLPSA